MQTKWAAISSSSSSSSLLTLDEHQSANRYNMHIVFLNRMRLKSQHFNFLTNCGPQLLLFAVCALDDSMSGKFVFSLHSNLILFHKDQCPSYLMFLKNIALSQRYLKNFQKNKRRFTDCEVLLSFSRWRYPKLNIVLFVQFHRRINRMLFSNILSR